MLPRAQSACVGMRKAMVPTGLLFNTLASLWLWTAVRCDGVTARSMHTNWGWCAARWARSVSRTDSNSDWQVTDAKMRRSSSPRSTVLYIEDS